MKKTVALSIVGLLIVAIAVYLYRQRQAAGATDGADGFGLSAVDNYAIDEAEKGTKAQQKAACIAAAGNNIGKLMECAIKFN